MFLQITLTVSEAKAIIASAAVSLPEITNALKGGKILLKGGTTVSALSELLINKKLGICGRVTSNGTKGPADEKLDAPHSVLIDKGIITDVDALIEEEAKKLGKDDVFIISPNAIDIYGDAAIMAGSPLGGNPGKMLGGLMAEGVNILILSGLEKLIPIKIADAIKASGRKKMDISFGMAVGLIPLIGKVITEQAAIELLANVKCTVIGKGGICGGEGATTMVVEGEKDQIKKIYEHVMNIKGISTSGSMESLVECFRVGLGCKDDLACIYRKPIKPSYWRNINL